MRAWRGEASAAFALVQDMTMAAAREDAPEPSELLFGAERVDAAWSAAFRRGLAMRPDWLTACEEAVEKRYAANPSARDGFSRIACGLVSAKRLESAVAFFERDRTAGRMQRWQFLRAVAVRVALGQVDEAKQTVAEYYMANSTAQDGWAEIGWYLQTRRDYVGAAELFARDRAAGRLSAKAALRAAEVEARLGDVEAAQRTVADAYDRDRALRDGFVRLGFLRWHHRDGPGARELCDRDRAAGRMSPARMLDYAEIVARTGDRAAAASLVDAAYVHAPALRDGHGRIALVLLERGLRSEAAKLLEHDRALGRQSPRFGLHLAATIVQVRPDVSLDELGRIIDAAYEADGSMRDGWTQVAKLLESSATTITVRRCYEQDLAVGRMASAGLKRYIHFLAKVEPPDVVENVIKKAYGGDSRLTDGFVGLARALWQRGDVERALTWYSRDHELGRASFGARAEHARMLHRQGCAAAADAVIVPIPSDHLARAEYARELRRPDLVPAAVLQEIAQGRVHTALRSGARWAACLAGLAGVEASARFCDIVYSRDRAQTDVFSCAARARLAVDDHASALELFAADRQWQRASPDSLVQYAHLLPANDPRRREVRDDAAAAMAAGPSDAWLAEHGDHWHGRTCVIVGTGPSIRELEPGLLRGLPVFATNGAYALPGLEFSFFVSVSDVFWRHHVTEINRLRCERMFLPHWLAGCLQPASAVSWLTAHLPRRRDAADQPMPVPLGFPTDVARGVALGGSVVAVCLQLALHLGFQRAILLGVDHDYGGPEGVGRTRGGTLVSAARFASSHFTANYYRESLFHLDYMAMEDAYRLCAEAYARAGCEVLNATPGTKLDVFPQVALHAALADSPRA